ncbi:MAG: hypothetical protein A3A80_01620 [Candidatus Terrybacteria bacterium RIFCSPLOWO2_01_FULL_44_24]|uniref:Steroid 5-alpha reductase C-terminal domain-containing protein n=1 Tax=Candidatus Terrybacteria bacterium RIFCSPHIGHO2_01_FULL_43_35 TaxID=1802361 RepID=A0A1G2PH80_9BACT|nr:MAG: hypothetical protein A2828_03995 [Candidatus Terrybacteria bacterium RIFCSPHIGHO2_01_FULL_43_35]OHA49905.1 MAG: hypothetical protein A3B75_03305 [Candidatus Terrybacteria bacterium RIFCSPHIGHO2_02_FULL_43_14]OHA51774.1 MAG: hypothetical protein A3A80_01620 [Candidatus Terrybacteria bacterium RIFCSPLOWO2_01_FULL_44_24]
MSLAYQKLINPVVMWMFVIVGIAASFIVVPAGYIFEPTFSRLFILFGIIYWPYFYLNAVYVNTEAIKSASAVEKLITHGVYGTVRHPMYSADLVLAWSAFFYAPDLRMLFSVLWTTGVIFLWIEVEETVLTGKFGNKYKEYKLQVPKIIPRLHRRK